jgi:hypothetical protein
LNGYLRISKGARKASVYVLGYEGLNFMFRVIRTRGNLLENSQSGHYRIAKRSEGAACIILLTSGVCSCPNKRDVRPPIVQFQRGVSHRPNLEN